MMEHMVQEHEDSGQTLELYKLYVELADRVSQRRVDASKFYITILSALLAVVPFVLDGGTPPDVRRLVFLLLGLLGLLLCVVWVVNIQSYRQLNGLKFRVIHEMEEKLPFAPFAREWELLRAEAEGFRYRRLSRVEQWVPALLALPYAILVVLSLVR